jgi:RND superfamily putative drug exporter
MLARIADLTWHRPKLVLALVGALVVVAGVLAHDVEHHLTPAGFTDPSSESERATERLRGELGHDAHASLVLLVRAKDGGRLDVRSATVRDEVARVAGELGGIRHVGRVADPLHGNDPAAHALVAKDGRSLLIAAYLATQNLESDGGDVAKAAKKIRSNTLDLSVGGFAPGFQETEAQTREDLTKAEIIAFPALTVLLLLVFRGAVAAAIPLMIGVFSILGTFLFLRIMSAFVDTSLFALNIATALSLGLAVDYALLLVSRYREEIEREGPTREAHRRTVLTAGRTSLFSGFTVAVAMAALMLLPQRFLYSVGAAGAAVGAISAIMAVLVVPSMLALLGPRINALSIRRGHALSDESDRWYRLAHGVMRRPVIVALASGTLLLAAAAPLLSTVLTGPSAEAVPPSKPSYAVNEYIEGSFGRAVTEGITVTVGGKVSDAQLARLARQVEATPGISGGTAFTRASATTAFATFAPARAATSRTSQDAVDAIRARGVPGVAGAHLLVSGNTARFIDQKQSLVDHLPLVIGVVGGSTLILLFLLTGSVLLPLKTLLMNGLTLAATLGVIVLSFQEGWLSGVLGYTGPEAVEVTTLVFLFAVIFGLATDYAVLVVARIKEHHDLGSSNAEAVALGIGHTGRVISAAAVMIAVVFMAFAVSEVFFMKQAAVGQAVGVLIDATIVRALLVPALMRLFGEWNWWAPAPLRRLHARYGFQE